MHFLRAVSHSILHAQPLQYRITAITSSIPLTTLPTWTPGTPRLAPSRRTRLTDAKSVYFKLVLV